MLKTLETLGQVLVVKLRGEVVSVLLAQSFRTEYVESAKKYRDILQITLKKGKKAFKMHIFGL